MKTYTHKDFFDKQKFITQSLDEYIKWEEGARRIYIEKDLIEKIEFKSYYPISKIETKDQIERILSKTELLIVVKEIGYKVLLTKQIIHQLCSRIWSKVMIEENDHKYKIIDIYSKDHFTLPKEQLSIDEIYDLLKKLSKIVNFEDKLLLYIKDVLELQELSILYFPPTTSKQLATIYGIVSKYYTPLNQNIFRTYFLSQCHRMGLELDLTTSKQYFHKNFKSIYEFLKTKHLFFNDRLDISLVIEYGKNNGYRSYRFHWLVSIKNSVDDICIIKSDYNWRNNPKTIAEGDIYGELIDDIVKEGKYVLDGLTKQIKVLTDTKSENFEIDVQLILNQIKVAAATKERILSYWHDTSENTDLWDFVKCLVRFSNQTNSPVSSKMLGLIKKSAIEIFDEGFDVLKSWGEKGSRYIDKY